MYADRLIRRSNNFVLTGQEVRFRDKRDLVEPAALSISAVPMEFCTAAVKFKSDIKAINYNWEQKTKRKCLLFKLERGRVSHGLFLSILCIILSSNLLL